MKNRKLRCLTALGLVLSVALSLLCVIHASPSSQIQAEIDRLEQQADKIAQEKDALEEKMDANEEKILSFAENKQQIDAEVELLRLDVENLNSQIRQYNLLIAEKQSDLETVQSDLTELFDRYQLRMRAIQEQGDISQWSVVFQSESFSDMLNRRAMTTEIAKADQRMMGQLREASAAVLAAKEALGEEKVQLELRRGDLDEAQTSLEEKRAEAEKVLTALAADKEAMSEEWDKLFDEANELSDAIAKKEQEYNNAIRNEIGQGGGTPPASESGFLFPLNPSGFACITCPYGMRYHPVTGVYKLHNGVDLGAYQGTAIYATRSGTVTTAEYNYAWGNYVVINHGDGFSSLYAHMTNFVVSYGQHVNQGQVIGYVGSTGYSTGPHLHFTIYYNGSTVNPMQYVRLP